ncbi:VCBS repeat protein [Algoriphagus boseongensis]|uniref:VCBS repeat protein n=1 Tax=Algoriphagus boseongensis TaxID=1442587 RepID=A0A4R6T4Z3_9BACT|nr:VCBS repeat-containing protein [Algoriphagus boseongensis]TDQ14699.1 VCBS repeat protein [Algoriphagus boseongensis]
MKKLLYLSLFLFCFSSCKKKSPEEHTLFTLLSAEETGIAFRNDLSYTEKINPYTFRNFYNGAGVALGDINQDGLLDIFLSGNQTSNRLFLNQGNLKFKDITDQSGLNSTGLWSTGVSMADVNGDGLLDIYVCKSGPKGGERRHNELFINNGDLTFSEQSKAFGLAEEGLSQHAVFFDYDKDGDLDMYLLSNSGRSVGVFDLREGQREIRDPEGGNKLFRNEGGRFSDVSEEAGIFGSSIGYGLGVTVADLNQDNWPDLYVSNDFFERDYLYLNNQNGTFSEVLPDILPEISMGSMGADIADLDNDSRPDIFVTEMLPASWERIKTKTPFEEWDKYQANIKSGYHHQFTRNTLQRNLGFRPDSQTPVFSEVSRMAEVDATDWSWGALIFDADLDGLKDIFVANGIVKDLTDFDFVDFYVNNQSKIEEYRADSVLLTKMIDEFPSNPQQNYLFRNLGAWKFENIASQSGLEQLTFSSGAAYGDLDNDGDLDLIVNNLNESTFLYRNNASESKKGNFLVIDLGNNFGAKVQIKAGNDTYFQEFQPVKGYMSSVDSRLHFGLGTHTVAEQIEITWPDGSASQFHNIPSNQIFKPSKKSSSPSLNNSNPHSTRIFSTADLRIPFSHQESDFVDFDRDRLRFWMISNEGPKATKDDVNGDGLEDLFIPGSKAQSSTLLLQNQKGDFIPQQQKLFDEHALAEDVASSFFDANGDGALDLLVASGGIEFSDFSPSYQDRLYLNDGKGNYSLSSQQFSPTPTAFVLAHDWDQDGDQDIITGQRVVPFAYGVPVGLQFWKNDGRGNFTEVSQEIAPNLTQMGMPTDGKLADLDGDSQEELVVVGEWMDVRVFSFLQGKWVEKTKELGFSNTKGLWKCLQLIDVNGDGKLDILAGNQGLNSRIRTSAKAPLQLVVNDFDQNGTVEQILAFKDQNGTTPIVLKNSLLKQIPVFKKQLTTYDSYKSANLESLFPESVWANSLILQADLLETSLWINQGNGSFIREPLPIEVQSSAVYSIEQISTSSGSPYLVFAGNQSRIKPEMGSQMGSYGWVVQYQVGKGMKALLPEESGLFIPGETRSMLQVKSSTNSYLITFRNNDEPLVFKTQ